MVIDRSLELCRYIWRKVFFKFSGSVSEVEVGISDSSMWFFAYSFQVVIKLLLLWFTYLLWSTNLQVGSFEIEVSKVICIGSLVSCISSMFKVFFAFTALVVGLIILLECSDDVEVLDEHFWLCRIENEKEERRKLYDVMSECLITRWRQVRKKN